MDSEELTKFLNDLKAEEADTIRMSYRDPKGRVRQIILHRHLLEMATDCMITIQKKLEE